MTVRKSLVTTLIMMILVGMCCCSWAEGADETAVRTKSAKKIKKKSKNEESKVDEYIGKLEAVKAKDHEMQSFHARKIEGYMYELGCNNTHNRSFDQCLSAANSKSEADTISRYGMSYPQWMEATYSQNMKSYSKTLVSLYNNTNDESLKKKIERHFETRFGANSTSEWLEQYK